MPANPGQATTLHVRRAVDGDATSVSWLIEHLNPLLLAQARWRMGTALEHVCEPADLVHDAWLVLLPRLPSLPPRDGRMTPVLLAFLSTTILRKTQNLLRREARRRVRSMAASDDPDEPAFDFAGPRSEVVSAVVRRETVSTVDAALDELPDRDREIILLRGVEQQRTEDIVEMLGVPRDVIYKRYKRALAKLRARLPDSVFAEFEND